MQRVIIAVSLCLFLTSGLAVSSSIRGADASAPVEPFAVPHDLLTAPCGGPHGAATYDDARSTATRIWRDRHGRPRAYDVQDRLRRHDGGDDRQPPFADEPSAAACARLDQCDVLDGLSRRVADRLRQPGRYGLRRPLTTGGRCASHDDVPASLTADGWRWNIAPASAREHPDHGSVAPGKIRRSAVGRRGRPDPRRVYKDPQQIAVLRCRV